MHHDAGWVSALLHLLSQVIVFAASDAAARAAADPLRTALWSEHQLSVLLPSGAEPVKALHAFRWVHTSGGVRQAGLCFNYAACFTFIF